MVNLWEKLKMFAYNGKYKLLKNKLYQKYITNGSPGNG